MFYLIDLERSIGSGRTTYWKAHKRGYTTVLEEAGKYSDIVAAEIVESDFDKRTVMVPESVVEKILKN